ncbi:hypothetical protein M5D96_010557 [Drosophila gunungcola]|uniref:SPRY domain-containing protein n=1 Tax=Drosophila gunungcola TaxID=103775 RepID=A0A9Q0BLZ1_9MUSC|nr:hypothetical protein M5D96_010557 [Drosophila gunungcola]
MTSRYCDCRFPSSTEIWSHMGHIPDLASCRCGKFGVVNTNPWLWDSNGQSDTLIAGGDIVFNPTRSRGTAMVRGNRSLEPGMVHYWEMLPISPLVGTDVVLCLIYNLLSNSPPRCLASERSALISLNMNSNMFRLWAAMSIPGASRTLETFSTAPNSRPMAKSFPGCLIGVYLDRSRGHLEFYLNRRSLGVAFTNVPVDPTVHIYPMVCSTSFRTVIRLINSTSVPDTLLLRSFQTLSIQKPHQLFVLRQIPGLGKLHWFLDMPPHGSR